MAENVIQTTHSLDFGCYEWEPPIPLPFGQTYWAFRVGSCDGLYMATANTYDIVAIRNTYPGNGHFEDVLQWFENSCKRDGKNLRFLEVMNKRFKRHLIEKRGFKSQGFDHVIKKIR